MVYDPENTWEALNLLSRNQMITGLPEVSLSQDKQWLFCEFPDESHPESSDSARSEKPQTEGAIEAVMGIVRTGEEKPAVTARRVVEVAQKYGPLYLCDFHGKPIGHPLEAMDSGPFPGCQIGNSTFERRRESVERWRVFARDIKDLAEFGSRVARATNFGDVKDHPLGKQVEELWGGIRITKIPGGYEAGPNSGVSDDPSEGQTLPVDLEYARQLIRLRVHDLVELARLKPVVEWNPDKTRFEFVIEPGVPGLFGVVVSQLVTGIGGAGRFFICDGCFRGYFRSIDLRMPKRGGLNYCEVCKEDSGRQRRAQREAKRRKSDGK